MKTRLFDTFQGLMPRDVAAIINQMDDTLMQSNLAMTTVAEKDTFDAYHADFLARFAHHSAAIEGSTLSTQDTQLVIEGEFLPSNDKQLADMFSVRGIYEGYDYAQRQRATHRPLDAELIKDIHERTALDCQPRTHGVYRRTGALITGSPVTPADPFIIPEAIDDLIFVYAQSEHHPVFKAAAFHAFFEEIHPFADGNGRVGRTIMNMMLLNASYPPIAVKSDHRGDYLAALETWQMTGVARPFISLVSESILNETQILHRLLIQTRRMANRSRGPKL